MEQKIFMKPKNFDIHNSDYFNEVPLPVFDENPEYIDFYRRAWQIIRDHVKEIPGMPQTPYMDEAFIETDIWIWDTCFMMFFCKYAPNVFPGIETLNNFYQPLLDNKPLPVLTVSQDLPDWTGLKKGEKTQLKIHIPDNPPLFAWAEYSYALMTGDKEHLKKLLLQDRYLQRHYEFFDNFTEPGYVTKYTRAPSCLIKMEDGYLWEGGRSGMDNTPRGRLNGKAGAIERPNHPRMLWVDAISQQALSAYCISKIADLLEERDLVAEWTKKYEVLKEKINRIYWDEADSIYYDVHNDTREFMKCVTPASFWPLLANIPSSEQVDKIIRYITNPNKLGGSVPWVTLARDDADFNAEHGHYWRGAVWLPTAYMGIKGLENYGKFDLANDSARKILNHMFQTWKNYEPHTIWECYAPNSYRPAQHGSERVRPDFCGWSGLGPAALFIENVIGIYSANAFTNVVKWALPPVIKGKLGIKNYSFGDVVFDAVYENGVISVKSNQPFTLEVNGKAHKINTGVSSFDVK